MTETQKLEEVVGDVVLKSRKGIEYDVPDWARLHTVSRPWYIPRFSRNWDRGI